MTFLTVAAGVRFVFPVRVRPSGPVTEDEDGESGEAEAAAEVLDRVRGWLHRGLTEHAAGAKTAAGYGYFGG